ncbi:hypothetical protein HT136_10215 [Novosphingobium profundi]|uniref:hypothetical protein n=1 Tax=Novosphingobium profundi TaxID=1774954 RepID=UPI001BD9230F|nr:hypothetical protein [Novosphingobium profundi]MBT0668741.1 hypothetical protein [Novosphingobium profundi]
MTERNDDLAPETVNAEQQDAPAQAQQVAEEAIAEATSVLGLEQSEKLSNSLYGANAQDLVDHMRQMDTSGTIDMSAYAGEEAMDDLEDRYGRESAPDPQLAADDS